MTRVPVVDGKQPDLFGTITKPVAQGARAARRPRKGLAKKTQIKPDGPAPDADDITHIAARLSPAELDEPAAALSDEALAHFALTAARQLRRRLVRGGGRKGQRSSPALERAARQLAAELGGKESTDDT